MLLFADLPARLASARDIIESLGGRIVEATGIGEAVARLDVQVAVDAVVVDASREDAPGFDPLLRRLNAPEGA